MDAAELFELISGIYVEKAAAVPPPAPPGPPPALMAPPPPLPALLTTANVPVPTAPPAGNPAPTPRPRTPEKGASAPPELFAKPAYVYPNAAPGYPGAYAYPGGGTFGYGHPGAFTPGYGYFPGSPYGGYGGGGMLGDPYGSLGYGGGYGSPYAYPPAARAAAPAAAPSPFNSQQQSTLATLNALPPDVRQALMQHLLGSSGSAVDLARPRYDLEDADSRIANTEMASRMGQGAPVSPFDVDLALQRLRETAADTGWTDEPNKVIEVDHPFTGEKQRVTFGNTTVMGYGGNRRPILGGMFDLGRSEEFQRYQQAKDYYDQLVGRVKNWQGQMGTQTQRFQQKRMPMIEDMARRSMDMGLQQAQQQMDFKRQMFQMLTPGTQQSSAATAGPADSAPAAAKPLTPAAPAAAATPVAPRETTL